MQLDNFRFVVYFEDITDSVYFEFDDCNRWNILFVILRFVCSDGLDKNSHECFAELEIHKERQEKNHFIDLYPGRPFQKRNSGDFGVEISRIFLQNFEVRISLCWP